jgi:5'-nucleotidase
MQTTEGLSLPHVLLTNDDGFDAPGLAAMYAALEGLARLSAVAPAGPASSAGHSVTDRGTIRVERRRVEPFGPICAVHGTPADCVRLGLIELLDRRPDWVIAGINRGGNLGVDVFYSGTVAAAREAAILGIPAVAVSQYVRGGEPDWPRAVAWTRTILQRLFEGPPDRRPPIWNVNLPALSPTEEPLDTIMAPLALTPVDVRYRHVPQSDAEGGDGTYEFIGEYSRRPAPPNTDVALVFDGHIVMTPLSLDLTCRAILP